eukprot:2626612-Alexandrium_andersonii.AAC.1
MCIRDRSRRASTCSTDAVPARSACDPIPGRHGRDRPRPAGRGQRGGAGLAGHGRRGRPLQPVPPCLRPAAD